MSLSKKEKVMLRIRIGLLIAGLMMICIFSSSAFADGITVLSINPASSTVAAGGSLTLDVNISGVTDLYSFQFDLAFTPGILSASPIVEGNFLSDSDTTFFIPGTIDNSLGLITFTANSLLGPGPGVDGNGALAILTLLGLAPGTSSIDFSNVELLDSGLNPIDVGLQSGSVTVTPNVTPVPEPSAVLLLIAGLSFLGFQCYSRNRKPERNS